MSEKKPYLDTYAIHIALGEPGWREVLMKLGVAETFLVNKHGPCPVCGGKDRFRFDNRGKGTFICSRCEAGDGFQLVKLMHRVDFPEARKMVIDAGGLEGSEFREQMRAAHPAPITHTVERSMPTSRVLNLTRESCRVEDCEPARLYLDRRGLWPLPTGAILKAHPSAEYWDEGKRVGRYAALVAPVRDCAGELVTAHVTYLTPDGQKLTEYTPRKILTKMVGRDGCHSPIMERDGEVLGVAEGIETALSAAKLTGIRTWAALNSTLMAKFEPPADLDRLVIFADRDVAGLESAGRLMQRLQERVRLELRISRLKDFNADLTGAIASGDEIEVAA